MVKPVKVIDALPTQIRDGIEGGYRWLPIKVDRALGEDFAVLCKGYSRDR